MGTFSFPEQLVLFQNIPLLYTIYQYNTIQYITYLSNQLPLFPDFWICPLLLVVKMLMIIIIMVVSILKKIRARLKNKLISKIVVVGTLAHEILGPFLIIGKCFKEHTSRLSCKTLQMRIY